MRRTKREERRKINNKHKKKEKKRNPMLIPRFELSQNDDEVILTIHIPYLKVSDPELIVDEGRYVTFYCQPYWLKVHLPCLVLDDDHCSAQYDPFLDNGTITAKLPKMVKGEHFPDLDLPSQLLISPTSLQELRFVALNVSYTH